MTPEISEATRAQYFADVDAVLKGEAESIYALRAARDKALNERFNKRGEDDRDG